MPDLQHSAPGMSSNTLTGLVACGGASSRMGQDKSLLRYHDREQRDHVADLIRPFCNQVFLSLNPLQQQGQATDPVITDRPEYRNTGPLAALLSAFDRLPESNLLMIGCDYPWLTAQELKRFLSSITAPGSATVFYNAADGFYEPLLGYYPASLAPYLHEQFLQGNFSLQRMLRDLRCKPYFPEDVACIQSVDDRETYERVLKILADKKRTGDT